MECPQLFSPCFQVLHILQGPSQAWPLREVFLSHTNLLRQWGELREGTMWAETECTTFHSPQGQLSFQEEQMTGRRQWTQRSLRQADSKVDLILPLETFGCSFSLCPSVFGFGGRKAKGGSLELDWDSVSTEFDDGVTGLEWVYPTPSRISSLPGTGF